MALTRPEISIAAMRGSINENDSPRGTFIWKLFAVIFLALLILLWVLVVIEGRQKYREAAARPVPEAVVPSAPAPDPLETPVRAGPTVSEVRPGEIYLSEEGVWKNDPVQNEAGLLGALLGGRETVDSGPVIYQDENGVWRNRDNVQEKNSDMAGRAMQSLLANIPLGMSGESFGDLNRLINEAMTAAGQTGVSSGAGSALDLKKPPRSRSTIGWVIFPNMNASIRPGRTRCGVNGNSTNLWPSEGGCMGMAADILMIRSSYA